jgi:transposase
MLYLTAETKILLAVHPVDFRKQIDGLVALCQHQLQQSPRSGNLFVFINRARTMIRILCYDRNGYWLATKRLSKGRYPNWPTSSSCSSVHALHAGELTKILKGLVVSDSRAV